MYLCVCVCVCVCVCMCSKHFLESVGGQVMHAYGDGMYVCMCVCVCVCVCWYVLCIVNKFLKA